MQRAVHRVDALKLVAARAASTALQLPDGADGIVEALGGLQLDLPEDATGKGARAVAGATRWRLKRWAAQGGAHEVRWTLRNHHGHWLSLGEDRQWRATRADQDLPSHLELLEVLPAHEVDGRVRLLGWDRRTCLGLRATPEGQAWDAVREAGQLVRGGPDWRGPAGGPAGAARNAARALVSNKPTSSRPASSLR